MNEVVMIPKEEYDKLKQEIKGLNKGIQKLMARRNKWKRKSETYHSKYRQLLFKSNKENARLQSFIKITGEDGMTIIAEMEKDRQVVIEWAKEQIIETFTYEYLEDEMYKYANERELLKKVIAKLEKNDTNE